MYRKICAKTSSRRKLEFYLNFHPKLNNLPAKTFWLTSSQLSFYTWFWLGVHIYQPTLLGGGHHLVHDQHRHDVVLGHALPWFLFQEALFHLDHELHRQHRDSHQIPKILKFASCLKFSGTLYQYVGIMKLGEFNKYKKLRF